LGWCLLVGVAITGASTSVRAATRVELLVIGNNRPFAADVSDSQLPVLRYADDDAAAFYDLLAGDADQARLLTVMDRETEATYGGLSGIARAPTVAEVRRAVSELAQRMDDNRRRGDQNVLYIFFSGHGIVRDGVGPSLALLDGGITQAILYDEILAKLPADYVHLFVDACHAEAVVRPRDVDAQHAKVTPEQARTFLTRSTLARFPHVGAIVAAASDAQAHEWDVLRQGLFTHELLSALRGGADVNRDGRIEYSEIYAFMAAANRSVAGGPARMTVIARPPELDRHVAVLELAHLRKSTTARITAVPASAGLVQLEDDVGRRIASVRGELGFVADLVVPAGEVVYVRAGGREARIEFGPGSETRFDALEFHEIGARARGAIEDAVRRGLFASGFGQGYYLGFIDQAPDFAPVTFAAETTAVVPADGAPALEARRSADARSDRSVGASLGATRMLDRAFAAGGGARIETLAHGADGVVASLDLAGARAAGISEWRAIASGGWSWSRSIGAARGWAAAMVGLGITEQAANGEANRWSALASAGPTAGLMVELTRRLQVGTELSLAGMLFRRDDAVTLTLVPSLFLGASFAL
jgi:hypothetical protein